MPSKSECWIIAFTGTPRPALPVVRRKLLRTAPDNEREQAKSPITK